MHTEEARQLLGFPPNSHPNPSQVKAAYRKKVWDYHPDRFPSPEKPLAESQFKSVLHSSSKILGLISRFVAAASFSTFVSLQVTEAYSLLISGGGHTSRSASYTRVVRTGVPNVHGGRRNRALSGMPFLLIVFGAVGLGGLNAARSYKKEKDAHASNNPFLP